MTAINLSEINKINTCFEEIHMKKRLRKKLAKKPIALLNKGKPIYDIYDAKGFLIWSNKDKFHDRPFDLGFYTIKSGSND